jgi:Cu(I)/Ag(I) efflux system membrane protein CusA/SilA
MLATGIRTDVGIKIYGASLDTINALRKNKKAIEGTEG